MSIEMALFNSQEYC